MISQEKHNFLTVVGTGSKISLSANTAILFLSLGLSSRCVAGTFNSIRMRLRARAASNDRKKVGILYLYLLYDEERNREELFLLGTFHGCNFPQDFSFSYL
jgi:hypothetical protein